MNRCTSERLESFLLDYGWSFHREGEGRWRSGFRGAEQNFPLSIILTENWVSFVVQPFVTLTIDWESWPEISRLLLELNARSSLAKFAISPEGRIELSIEALTRGFDFESLSLALGLLGHYADTAYDEILGGLDLIGYKYTESLNLLT